MFSFSFKLWYFITSVTEKNKPQKITTKPQNNAEGERKGSKWELREEYQTLQGSIKATMKPLNFENVSLYTLCKAALQKECPVTEQTAAHSYPPLGNHQPL